MKRRFSMAAVAAACFSFGLMLSNPSSTASAAPPAGRKCVGIAVHASKQFTETNRVYRVFEDGTVEACNDFPNGMQQEWKPVGR